MNYAQNKTPLIVAYGMGWDSTAMLVAMHQRGIRPDLILFADTGGEKPETYAYLPIINAWLRSVGFPEIVVVRYRPKRAPYSTLEGKCLANETLPSLAFGKPSCSLVFKVEPQHKFVKRWGPAILTWARGVKVQKCIGYDNGAQDCRRRAKADRAVEKRGGDKHYEYRYLLQEWGVDRAECQRLIESAGLPLPMKSACWFCPASKPSEVIWLRDNHPGLYKRALVMERGNNEGRHALKRREEGKTVSTVGLGRTFAWGTLEFATTSDLPDAPETLRP